jgi:hypothetical protein
MAASTPPHPGSAKSRCRARSALGQLGEDLCRDELPSTPARARSRDAARSLVLAVLATRIRGRPKVGVDRGRGTASSGKICASTTGVEATATRTSCPSTPARSDRSASDPATLNYGRFHPPACGCGQNRRSIAVKGAKTQGRFRQGQTPRGHKVPAP